MTSDKLLTSDILWIGDLMWVLAMLGLVVAVGVVAFREKKAQDKARKALALQPQPMDLEQGFNDPMSDGFGEPDPVDSFGTEDDFAAFDDKSFK